MAGVDEIDILNGLQFEQTAAASIALTLNGEGGTYEVVKTYAIPVPLTASQVRVIFNGNYDPDGANHCVRAKLTKVTAVDGSGVPTKTENTQMLEWTLINPDSATAADRMKEAESDVSASLDTTLHIDVAICEAEATTGLEVIVQIRSESGKEEWTTITRFVGPIGTPTSTAFGATEAIGQTTLTVTNPTAANFDHIGKFIFIYNTTPASSEIAWLMACGADA